MAAMLAAIFKNKVHQSSKFTAKVEKMLYAQNTVEIPETIFWSTAIFNVAAMLVAILETSLRGWSKCQ